MAGRELPWPRGIHRQGASPPNPRIGIVIVHNPESKNPSTCPGVGPGIRQKEDDKGLWKRGESRKLAHCSWITSQKCLLENVDSPPCVWREGWGAGGLIPASGPAWADHCHGSVGCMQGLSNFSTQAAGSVGSWVDNTCSLQPKALALLIVLKS